MRRRLPLIAFMLLTSAWGCTTLTRLFRGHREVKKDVIGVALPLSGKYEAVGKALLEGIKQGTKGSQLKIVTRDTEGDPDKAAAMLDELADQERAIAVLGGVISVESAALVQRADAIGIPLLTFSKEEGITSGTSYAFRNMITVRGQAKALAKLATCQLKLRSFAVLAPNEPNGQELTVVFTETATELGARVDPPQTYDAGQTTFTAEARVLSGRADPERRSDWRAIQAQINKEVSDPFRRRKALEKARASLPPILKTDALFLPDNYKTVSLIAPALAVEDVVTNACDAEDLQRIKATTGRERLQTMTLLGWSGWHSPDNAEGTPELIERGGKFVHCAYYVDGFFADSERPATRKFVGAFKGDHGGRTPNLLNAYAYDSALMFRQVLEKKSAPIDSAAFRDALASLENFEGATGATQFDSDRDAVKAPFFLTISPTGIKEAPLSKACSEQQQELSLR
ncbi:MAG: ABC transporter substrate-binding protein [Myxococcaceae bacterium]